MKWKQILDSKYEVSTEGCVRNSSTGKILKTYLTDDGYGKRHKIKLPINGKRSTYQIHRLLAIAFIPRIEGKNEVDHIDGDTLNNSLSNLRWVTRKENINNKGMSLTRIKNIIELYEEGLSFVEIRKKFI